jgi:fumarylacetoacetase
VLEGFGEAVRSEQAVAVIPGRAKREPGMTKVRFMQTDKIVPHPNDPSLRSFIDVNSTSDFPIQNLPYGVFSTEASPTPRVGVAIGEYVVDLWELEQDGRLDVGELGVFAAPALNPFMALGPKVWSRTRARISELLRHDNPELRDNAELRALALVPMKDVTLYLPITVAGYTDFYSSKEHATNVGTMFRDKTNPLLPNWLHIPIGYNGRSSTVVVSGTKVRRPRGQLKPPNAELPSFGPCRRLDFELEMGVVIGQPSPIGETLDEAQAEAMIFGFTLLNDWSARDIQQWEYVPLGPFQAKAFATSISPWIVTREALEPFRVHGPVQDPTPLPYLQQAQPNNYDMLLDVALRAAAMNDAISICRTNFKYMYWSSVQQLVHHTSSGCAMNVGDLLGSGTISGPDKHERGSLLEISWNGTEPIELPGGEKRTFLEDGDSLVMRGWCQGNGFRVGFGEVEGTITPAV